ncbi:MAG: hypothetical protein H7Y36_08265 [Armatimonadetes bacterium]|nr:hypothetical protein [Akkermansiaceae bacterium]
MKINDQYPVNEWNNPPYELDERNDMMLVPMLQDRQLSSTVERCQLVSRKEYKDVPWISLKWVSDEPPFARNEAAH